MWLMLSHFDPVVKREICELIVPIPNQELHV